MKVLVDYAHNDLWHSLVMLFEDRFGWELYRPAGMEWYEQGIWQFERQRLGDAVARQFLAPDSSDRQLADHSERDDISHPGRTMKMLTMDQARGVDIVISTLAENEPGWHRFAGEIGATYGIQVGNQGAHNQWGLAAFGLMSVTTPGFTPWVPFVTYHQEFSLADYRYDWPPAGRDLVATRVQCFTGTREYQTFQRVAGMVPSARFRWFGHCGEHDDLWGGDTHTVPEIAASMRDSRIAWHDKRWSDGYGHVLHGWFAVGRPLIGSSGYYLGKTDGVPKLGGALFEDGVTSFDVDSRSEKELADIVRRLIVDDDYHQSICDNVRARFEQVVRFDEEADAIREMFARVLP